MWAFNSNSEQSHVSKTRSAVYKWIDKFSTTIKKKPRLIVEKHSDTNRIQAMEDRIKELEQLLDKKVLDLVFKEKMIELASEELGIDIKNKIRSNPSADSGSTKQNNDSQ